jgi:hypothetical protein
MSAWYPRTGIPNQVSRASRKGCAHRGPPSWGEGGSDSGPRRVAGRTRKALRRPQRATLGRRI